MAGWWLVLLWVLTPLVRARVIDLAQRSVLSDLSGGFCRSYRFGGKWRLCDKIYSFRTYES